MVEFLKTLQIPDTFRTPISKQKQFKISLNLHLEILGGQICLFFTGKIIA
ncbi:hypothetical protein [Campylobacter fetus]|nr:hypothetical protein [Campylobacter fetus]